MKISAVILAFNSESTIGATIESALKVADAVYVVDSGSTDHTLAIVGRTPAKLFNHTFENYGAQRNWAIDNLPLGESWELHLDADERLSDELAAEIAYLKSADPAAIDGYYIPRLVYFLGRPIRHGGMYPIWHMRLFRHGAGRCETRLYDQHFIVRGPTARLRHPMIDDQRNSLGEWSTRHLRWADFEMAEMLRQGGAEIAPQLSGSPLERQRALRGFYCRAPRFVRAFGLFFYRYVLRLGFLDGKAGLIFFVLQSFWFRFLIDAKLYEHEGRDRALRS